MNKAILALALGAGFCASATAATFKGYIIDEKCSKIASMKGDVDCANKCIKGGSPAVLVSDDGKVYKIANQIRWCPWPANRSPSPVRRAVTQSPSIM